MNEQNYNEGSDLSQGQNDAIHQEQTQQNPAYNLQNQQPTQPNPAYAQDQFAVHNPTQPYPAYTNFTQETPVNETEAFQSRAQHSYTQSQSQPAKPEVKKDKKTIKTFVVAFIGAALACLLAFGINSCTSSKSTVTIGGSGESTITVEGEDATLAEVVSAKVLPSVVNIDVYTKSSSSSSYFSSSSSSSSTLTESSLGSGVIISSDGYILTNYHVIEDADKLQVVANGSEYEATVVGTDESSDLAVIKINASGLTAIEIGSSADLKTGEWVMAAGSPYGLEQSVSTGIVSATSRTTSSLSVSSSSAVYVNMIQTDAAINPGNSGGPLVDKDGKLIGINTIIASSSGSSSGVGFAIPVDYAINIAQQLIEGKTPSHAYLGISMATINSSAAQKYGFNVSSGVYVNSVLSGSAAEKAGLKQGDIITKINDTSITSTTDLSMAVRTYNPGDTVTVTYYRDNSQNTTQVTLGSDAS